MQSKENHKHLLKMLQIVADKCFLFHLIIKSFELLTEKAI